MPEITKTPDVEEVAKAGSSLPTRMYSHADLAEDIQTKILMQIRIKLLMQISKPMLQEGRAKVKTAHSHLLKFRGAQEHLRAKLGDMQMWPNPELEPTSW